MTGHFDRAGTYYRLHKASEIAACSKHKLQMLIHKEGIKQYTTGEAGDWIHERDLRYLIEEYDLLN